MKQLKVMIKSIALIILSSIVLSSCSTSNELANLEDLSHLSDLELLQRLEGRSAPMMQTSNTSDQPELSSLKTALFSGLQQLDPPVEKDGILYTQLEISYEPSFFIDGEAYDINTYFYDNANVRRDYSEYIKDNNVVYVSKFYYETVSVVNGSEITMAAHLYDQTGQMIYSMEGEMFDNDDTNINTYTIYYSAFDFEATKTGTLTRIALTEIGDDIDQTFSFAGYTYITQNNLLIEYDDVDTEISMDIQQIGFSYSNITASISIRIDIGDSLKEYTGDLIFEPDPDNNISLINLYADLYNNDGVKVARIDMNPVSLEISVTEYENN